MPKLIIIGRGDHAKVVANAIERRGMFAIILQVDESGDYKIVGDESQLAFVAIGNNSVREKLSKLNYNFNCNIIHPTSSLWLDKVSDLQKGCYFGANSVVENGAKVGNFCIINTSVVLEHDSSVGDYSHLCPGVVTGGRVKIGSRTTVGISACIRDGVSVGDNVIVGMGAVVVNDIPDNAVVYGNPAKFIRVNK